MINRFLHIFGGGCRRAADAAVPRWICLRRYRRMFVTLAAIMLLCSGAVTIQRIVLQRADPFALATRSLQPGEMVWLRNADGTVSLRLGDGISSQGRIPVDPAASRVNVDRPLDFLRPDCNFGFSLACHGNIIAMFRPIWRRRASQARHRPTA